MTATQQSPPARKRDWRYNGAALLAIIVVVIILILRRGGGEEEDVPAVVTAEVATVQIKPFATTVDVLGTVQPRAGHSAELSAPEATRVQRVYVALGDRVSAGQPLVQLDVSVWAAKRQQAEVGLETAQQAFDRAQRLLSEGIAARKDAEAAAADLARARAELQEARRIETLGTIRSPINGVVVDLKAALAQPVDAGQPIVAIVDPRGLEIIFHVAASDAGRIMPGAPVELSSGQEQQRYAIGRGTIQGVSAAVDATGSVAVRATIAAPTRPLKSGEQLAGRIIISERRALVVPLAALVPNGDEVQVFVLDAENVAHATPVTVGNRSETEAEIVSGLKGGERVVTSGAYGVTDSAKVQIGTAK
jgi:membrane fusion protein, multidrug efflux system